MACREESIPSIFIGHLIAVHTDVVIKNFRNFVAQIHDSLCLHAVFQRGVGLRTMAYLDLLPVFEVIIEIESDDGSHTETGVPHELKYGVATLRILELIEVVQYVLYPVK